jgi:glycosyltransferase involved in cell wall biosynthesis
MTVVIPTRDRPELLADCLASLDAQTARTGEWEVLVVDDGSDEPLAPVVERAAAEGLPARCLRQDKAGLNAARNRGVSDSSGEIVAFLDDDTLVSPNWAEAVDRGFERSGCDALGGRTILKLEDGGEFPRWLTQGRLGYLSSYDLGDHPRSVSEPPFPVGANFAVRRDALTAMEGFAQGLDRVGNELISNGEFEFLRRLVAGGGHILYWPEAEVAHRVPRERLTKEWFRRRAHAQGVSDVRTNGVAGPYPLQLAREAVFASRAAPILVKRLIEGRGPFDAEMWLISSRGRLEELRRQRREARTAG